MSIGALLLSLGRSLAFTLLLEGVFALVTGRRSRQDMLVVAAVNVATNPPLVLVYHLARRLWRSSWLLIALLECGALAAEALLYKRYGGSFKRPLLFAAGANLFSFGLGVLLNRLT